MALVVDRRSPSRARREGRSACARGCGASAPPAAGARVAGSTASAHGQSRVATVATRSRPEMLSSVMIVPGSGHDRPEFGRRGDGEQRARTADTVAVGHVGQVDRDRIAFGSRTVQHVGELVGVGQVDVAGWHWRPAACSASRRTTGTGCWSPNATPCAFPRWFPARVGVIVTVSHESPHQPAAVSALPWRSLQAAPARRRCPRPSTPARCWSPSQ